MTSSAHFDAPPSEPPEARHRALHEALRAFPASLFQFDPRMREGWYADRYFVRTTNTVAFDQRDPVVRMQVFAKQHGIIAGVYEVIRMLQTQLARHPYSGRAYAIDDLTIETLIDGDPLAPRETALLITGPYIAFAHLETDYLGVLARRSLVATNVRRVMDAANGKPVIFMGARHDDWRVQTPDGYAARVGGAGSVSSDAGGAWWGASGVGTMPHAMIAAFGGDVVAATLAFTRYCHAHEPDVKVVSLVDYHNDVVRDALAVAREVPLGDEVGDDGLLNSFDFTADVVMVDGRLESKVGRGYAPNARLVRVDHHDGAQAAHQLRVHPGESLAPAGRRVGGERGVDDSFARIHPHRCQRPHAERGMHLSLIHI